MVTKTRSPNYPSVDLATAVSDVKALYNKNGTTRVGLEVAAKVLGYKSLSGPARSRLSALRQYGLADMTSGYIQPNSLGLVLAMRSPESPEYQKALRDAAFIPEIFRELSQTHRQASEDAIRHHLVSAKKFSPEGARHLAEAFRATMRLVSLEEESYDQGMTTEVESVPLHKPYQPGPRVGDGTLTTGSAQEVLTVRLRGSRTLELRFNGGKARLEDLALLRRYLDLMEDTFQDDPEEGP